jgi:ABC-type transporter Mla maintaining outer membrane lipid asymmetry permease subunit MlaE
VCLPWLCVQVSEQVDSLRVLFTDPVDYLVTPRVLASMIAGPILNVLCFCMGELHTDAALTTHKPVCRR